MFNIRQAALQKNSFTRQKNSTIWTMTMSRLWCKFDWIIRGRPPFTGNRWKINLSAMVTDASDYSSQHWLIWFPIEFGRTLSRIWKSNTMGEKGDEGRDGWMAIFVQVIGNIRLKNYGFSESTNSDAVGLFYFLANIFCYSHPSQ